jgi:hypothetical protein
MARHTRDRTCEGLENYTELFQKLTTPNGAIKVHCEVAEDLGHFNEGLHPG